METRIITSKITLDELKTIAYEQYGNIIKAVVDIEQGIMGAGGELHVDIQSILIEENNYLNSQKSVEELLEPITEEVKRQGFERYC